MGSSCVVSGMLSVVYMPVPDALCIIFSSPALVIILSACLLGYNSKQFDGEPLNPCVVQGSD